MTQHLGLCLAGMFLCPLAAVAHPHIFVDTTIEVIFNEAGLAEAVRIGWVYDEFISLSIIESQSLDPDYDGILTPEARVALSGFDMDWDADFEGDTYLTQGGAPLALARPSDWTADYADGKVSSTHVRRLQSPVDVTDVPLAIKSYDPGFYTAYTVIGNAALTGRDDCAAEVFTPDTDAADEALLSALAQLPTTADIEIAYPAVGATYAQEIRITCNAAF
jgi:ABC-type uncharacterized transport system substrate-binding protein